MKPGFPIIVLCLSTVAVAADTPTPVTTWVTQVQALGAKFHKGETSVQTEAARKAFLDALEKEHKSKRIQFAVKVREVRWKDGIAEVYTESELGARPKVTPQTPMLISRALPFELRMTVEEAAAIKPGTQLRFVGTMEVQRSLLGMYGRPKDAHLLYTVRHEYLSGSHVGVFTSSDGEIRIGDRVYPNRWAKEEK